MNFLGVDFGKKYIGLALGTKTPEAPQFSVAPLSSIRVESLDQALKSLISVCQNYKVSGVVFGIPILKEKKEGAFAKEIRTFSLELKGRMLRENNVKLQVHFMDEFLTSFESRRLIMGVKKTRSGKRDLENGIAAAIILQNFLDSTKADLYQTE